MPARLTNLSKPRRHKIVRYKAGSRVAQIVELLEEPTPITEVMNRFGLTEKQARDAISYINQRVGYGIRDDDGLLSFYE